MKSANISKGEIDLLWGSACMLRCDSSLNIVVSSPGYEPPMPCSTPFAVDVCNPSLLAVLHKLHAGPDDTDGCARLYRFAPSSTKPVLDICQA
jgi:hypothetical protein